jgi:hypothetical protein
MCRTPRYRPHHPHIIGALRCLVPDNLGSAIMMGFRDNPRGGRVALLEWT